MPNLASHVDCLESIWYLQARQDLAQMGTLAGNAGRKLSNMAQSFMKDLQGSY